MNLIINRNSLLLKGVLNNIRQQKTEFMPPIQCEYVFDNMHRNCGLFFQQSSELQNHKSKFCVNSKYGDLDNLEKHFKSQSNNRDISLYGKMSLAKQGKGFDFDKAEVINDNHLDAQYRKILKEIEEEKHVKNRLENQKQKAFRELEALQKQQQQLIIDDKRKNLQQVIFRREQLAREEDQLQKQLKSYNNKKNQWDKSQIKVKQAIDHPYEEGIKAGKIKFQRQMLQQKKHNLELELNGKKRQKEKLQRQLLSMSAVDQIKVSRAATQKGARSNILLKVGEQSQQNYQPQFNNSAMIQSRHKNFYASNMSKKSSNLGPDMLKGNEKIFRFNVNKQGKSQQDKLIEELKAQQYDDLQILSKLPKNSELYNMKLRQYQQLSQQRMEVYQKAQRQRVQKMKRQFQFQKQINARQRENKEWVSENRKNLMNQQLEYLKNNDVQEQTNNQYSQPNIPSINNFSERQFSSPSIQRVEQKNPVKKNSGNIKSSRPQISNLPLSNKQGLQSYPFNAPKQINKKQKDEILFGYRISVLNLRNYSHKKAIKIKLVIYEQYYRSQDEGMKYQFATIYHDEKVDPTSPAYNPAFQNKLDPTGAIGYNQSFYVPQNLQELFNNNQKQIYLLIIAAEKDQKKITNQPKPYAWYSLKITHFGQIKEGRFTFNLYGDDIMFPIPADMNKMKKKKQEQLSIELQQVLLDQQMLRVAQNRSIKKNPSNVNLPNSSDRGNVSIADRLQPSLQDINQEIPSKNSLNGSKHNMNYPLKMKNIKNQDLKNNINEHYFFSNQKSTQFSHCALKKPLNFDVSVAALRTLPSYIGPVKLQINFLDANNAHVLPRQEFLAEVATDLYNPLVNFTKKIRNETKIPPSTIVFIRMIALSALDYHVYSLGFSLIYLFLDKDGDTIKTNKTTDYYMTSGYYQLPIFWGNIQPQYIDIEQLLVSYPTIPCASILIGILQNASKISNPMPEYRQKIYNTILFQVDQNQAKLFQQQYKRQPLDTNTLISGYLQHKGIKKNYSGQQVNKYLFRTLTFGPQSMKSQLQLKWMAEYQEYFGINVIFDKLTIPETELKYYYFVTLCISPPANYYKSKSFDLTLMRKINFETSKTNELQYTDNEIFLGSAYDRNSAIIIQVNRLQIFESESTQADTNIQGYAYTIIPLFQINEKIRAANVQKDALQLYNGDFDANNISQLQKNLPAFMNKIKKQKKSECELSFRLLNGYFMNQYSQHPLTSKNPLYKQIQPENMEFETALDEVNAVLSNNYNLQIS